LLPNQEGGDLLGRKRAGKKPQQSYCEKQRGTTLAERVEAGQNLLHIWEGEERRRRDFQKA